MSRIIISGDPGTTWTNDTERVYYQFIAALNNTCGVCLQYHLKVSDGAWPIPIHYGCRCIQRQIKPGQTAGKPFCDYREVLDKMPQEEKRAAIGASNYKLLKSGLATWEDIITSSRVRDFREVVAKKRLTFQTIVKHGVKPAEANRAYSAVHTEEHEHIECQRKELLQKLTGAGLSQQNIVNKLSKGLAARVTIAPGPIGPYTEGPAWSGGKLSIPARGTAAELARLIAGWKPPVIRPVPKPAPVPTAQKVSVEDGVVKIEVNGQIVAVVPGQTVMGRTYDEWLRIARGTK